MYVGYVHYNTVHIGWLDHEYAGLLFSHTHFSLSSIPGICASSMPDAVGALKSFVTTLDLPRGLLHGADKDGVPIEIEDGVYIKYNSGGVYSFADIRKSGMGFDALWKPGDAMLEHYDGDYRGVYFQVELSDGEFRQYLVPLDTFQ
mmetsp:Transcript_18639/g.46139  ORF Transcript_18639/g.46139 Transcript_18639/m.46139 type:complete len:146 (+) Transcript_18639:364-801(+)